MIKAKAFSGRDQTKGQCLRLADELNKIKPNTFAPNKLDWSISARDSVRDTAASLERLGYRGAQLQGWEIDPAVKSGTILAISGTKFPILVREPIRGFGTQIVLLGSVFPAFKEVMRALRPILADGQPVLTVRPAADGAIGLALVASRIPHMTTAGTARQRLKAAAVVNSIESILSDCGFVEVGDGSWSSRRHHVIVEFPTETTVVLLDAPF